MASITKNIANTGKLAVSGTSTALAILTNPFVWIFVIGLFFPLDMLNYLILFVVNFTIVMGNVLIFVAQIILYSIINLAGMLINIPIQWFNDLSITIPFPGDDIELSLPNLPLIPSVAYPPFGAIPTYSIEDVRIFEPGTCLILYILDLLGVNYPWG